MAYLISPIIRLISNNAVVTDLIILDKIRSRKLDLTVRSNSIRPKQIDQRRTLRFYLHLTESLSQLTSQNKVLTKINPQ